MNGHAYMFLSTLEVIVVMLPSSSSGTKEALAISPMTLTGWACRYHCFHRGSDQHDRHHASTSAIADELAKE